ncbi:Hypothetical protein mma_2216 [Janthinobacterium sp. Marseille]|nr:hypothetical protein [Janthinobacterium sp. Marseille]ABR91438.1 Hypothetical protein mma_2216 [Janthinobacterium sp. Marseille]
MKLPAQGTRGRVVVEYLAQRDHAQIEAIVSDLAEQLPRKAIRAAVAEMYDRGVVVNLSTQELSEERRTKFSDVVALSEAARDDLEDEEMSVSASKRAASIVPPRVVNVLQSPELSPSLYLNTKGTREGSDWSQFKSRQL